MSDLRSKYFITTRTFYHVKYRFLHQWETFSPTVTTPYFFSLLALMVDLSLDLSLPPHSYLLPSYTSTMSFCLPSITVRVGILSLFESSLYKVRPLFSTLNTFALAGFSFILSSLPRNFMSFVSSSAIDSLVLLRITAWRRCC